MRTSTFSACFFCLLLLPFIPWGSSQAFPTNYAVYLNDADGDGVPDSEDCAPNDPTIGAATEWFADADEDGFGDGSPIQACTQPAGYADNNNDCNDQDPAINPQAEDYPDDGIDSDCDGAEEYTDDDTDTDGIPDFADNCSYDSNPDQEDMDDDGAGDACDTDIDGDGVDNDDDCDPYAASETGDVWFADRDGDGYGSDDYKVACSQPDGYVTTYGDCNDDDPNIHPYAYDAPDDNLDANCDGIDPIEDADWDGVSDTYDNCPIYNPDQADTDEDGIGDACDEGTSTNNAPEFVNSSNGRELLVGESFTFTIKAVDTDANDMLTLRIDSVLSVPSGRKLTDLAGASFSPAQSVTADNVASITMSWTPNREHLGEIFFFFSATDQEGNSTWHFIPFLVDLPFALEEEITQPITTGAGQHFQMTIRIQNSDWHELDEVTIMDGNPGWLQVDKVAVDGRSAPNAMRLWGTPPANATGVIRPVILARTLFAKWSDIVLEIDVRDCNNRSAYRDKDGDGYGSMQPYDEMISCTEPAYYVTNNEDCDDQDAAVSPDAPEVMHDGIDNNCNGEVDETGNADGAPTLYLTDIDAYVGETVTVAIRAIDPNPGDLVTLKLEYVEISSRVDPVVYELEGATFSPSLPHTAADSAVTLMTWTPREDQRGYISMYFSATDQHGNKSEGILYSFVDRPLVLKPIAPVVVGTNQSFEAYMTIEDADWHELNEEVSLENAPSWLQAQAVTPPVGEQLIRIWGTTPAGSWGIYTPTIHARSIFGQEDSQEIQIRVGNCQNRNWYADRDGDGFGDSAMLLTACWQPTGYVSEGGDCHDGDASIYPGATELMDGIDNNCNGEVDEAGSCFASQVISFRQGYRPDGKTIGRERSNPALALGAPQENNRFNFVSLGFGGELVLELGSLVYDDGTEAPDMMVVETTWGWSWRHCYEGELAGNPETMVMEVSANGNDWVSVPGTFCRNAKVDLSPVVGEGKLPYVRFVKITDTSNPADFHPSSNGYDVDGILTCPALFDERQTNSRIAGAYNPNFFNEAPEEEELQSLQFYPNPVKDQLTIQTGTTEKLEVKVYSLQGSLIYQGQHQPDPASGAMQLDLGELAQGVYLIRLQGETLQQYLKIMKE